MATVDVVRHPDAVALAEAVAARLATCLVERQTDAGAVHVCLTGGGIGTASLAALAAGPARDAVDWGRVHLWWGDERFLPAGDLERNETGARAALVDRVRIPPGNVHPMPAAGGQADVDAAAAAYADELARFARPEDHAAVPSMAVCLLGIGPDAHVASLFPGLPAIHDDRPVVAVRGAPKPPPTRITLTLPALTAAREVWILAAGVEKAAAVRLALDPEAGALQVPAAAARGRERTLFLLDDAAASKLPPALARPGP